jgi:hypothetical protein
MPVTRPTFFSDQISYTPVQKPKISPIFLCLSHPPITTKTVQLNVHCCGEYSS